MKWIVVFATLFLAPSVSVAQKIELKGYFVGLERGAIQEATETASSDLSAGAARNESTDCRGEGLELCSNRGKFHCEKTGTRSESCSRADKVTFGPYYTNVRLSFLDGKCVAVFFSPTDADLFDQGLSGLVAKFGAYDTDKKETVQNAMGAEFLNREVTWLRGGTTIQAIKYSGTIDSGMVMLYDAAKLGEYFKDKRALDAARMTDSM